MRKLTEVTHLSFTDVSSLNKDYKYRKRVERLTKSADRFQTRCPAGDG